MKARILLIPVLLSLFSTLALSKPKALKLEKSVINGKECLSCENEVFWTGPWLDARVHLMRYGNDWALGIQLNEKTPIDIYKNDPLSITLKDGNTITLTPYATAYAFPYTIGDIARLNETNTFYLIEPAQLEAIIQTGVSTLTLYADGKPLNRTPEKDKLQKALKKQYESFSAVVNENAPAEYTTQKINTSVTNTEFTRLNTLYSEDVRNGSHRVSTPWRKIDNNCFMSLFYEAPYNSEGKSTQCTWYLQMEVGHNTGYSVKVGDRLLCRLGNGETLTLLSRNNSEAHQENGVYTAKLYYTLSEDQLNQILTHGITKWRMESTLSQSIEQTYTDNKIKDELNRAYQKIYCPSHQLNDWSIIGKDSLTWAATKKTEPRRIVIHQDATEDNVRYIYGRTWFLDRNFNISLAASVPTTGENTITWRVNLAYPESLYRFTTPYVLFKLGDGSMLSLPVNGYVDSRKESAGGDIFFYYQGFFNITEAQIKRVCEYGVTQLQVGEWTVQAKPGVKIFAEDEIGTAFRTQYSVILQTLQQKKDFDSDF